MGKLWYKDSRVGYKRLKPTIKKLLRQSFPKKKKKIVILEIFGVCNFCWKLKLIQITFENIK
jgi:hypothetical protein